MPTETPSLRPSPLQSCAAILAVGAACVAIVALAPLLALRAVRELLAG